MFIRKLFSRNSAQTEEANVNKWQHKLHLAQINPEPYFDLSSCSLDTLPAGVYSQFRIYRKERLLLNDNLLTTLPDDSNNILAHLTYSLVVLDLSRNQIEHLPVNLGLLVNLKELRLSNNRLKAIPESCAAMKSLQIIKISHNQLERFPAVFCDMVALQQIDLSYNKRVTQVPSTIRNLIRLERLHLEGTNIDLTIQTACDQGIDQLFDHFKNDQMSYDLLTKDKARALLTCAIKQPTDSDSLQSYLTKKDDQKRRLIAEELLNGAKLLEATNRRTFDNKKEILMKLRQDQLTINQNLKTLNEKKVADKSSIVSTLTLIEDHSSKLLDQLNGFHSRSRSYSSCNPADDDFNRPGDLINSIEDKLNQLMASKDQNKELLISELVKEDKSLSEAIVNLIETRRARNTILFEQISLIENELYHITKAELQRRANQVDQETDKIDEQRMALTSLLKDLHNQSSKDDWIPGVSQMDLLQDTCPGASLITPSAPPMKLYDLIECVICLDEQAEIILAPCGHICTCSTCSTSLSSCPLCRTKINEKIVSN